MLIEYGNTVVLPDWKLRENAPTGYTRIYYVISGDVTYEAVETMCCLKPGYLYALPSTVPYRAWRDTRSDFACTYLHVDFLKAHINGLIETEVKKDSCLERFIRTIQAAIAEERIELLEQMADSFQTFFCTDPAFSYASEIQNTVQKYIMKHISEPLSIESLCRPFAYHPNYFISLFRRETGYTPHRYILQLRMQYAVVLLNKGMSNQDVCYACGYQDSSAFSRAFRSYYGVSPQKYVKGYRKP